MQDLGSAATARELGEAAVARVVALGYPMPSLYLARGGRLRCYGVRGYWQIYDGFPPALGLIGLTFTSGTPQRRTSDAGGAAYVELVADVVDEICVPVLVGSRVVGALNVESTTPLPPECEPQLTEVAAAVGRRLGQLGGVPSESVEQKLVRHAAFFGAATTQPALLARILQAATDLSHLDSGLVMLGEPPTPAADSGPIGPALAMVTPLELERVAGWVRARNSAYSVTTADGYGFPGRDGLLRLGARAFVAVPLDSGSDHVGVLLLASSDPRPETPEVVEALELLAALAAVHLRSLHDRAALQVRAETDALTGLGHHATFRAALAGALASGAGVAVLIIDLDDFKAVNDAGGHLLGDRVLKEASSRLRTALRAADRLYRIGGDEFATVLAVGDGAAAMEVAERCLARVREGTPALTVSIGVAVAAADETADSLLGRADGALYEVKRSGRNAAHLAD